MHSMPKGALFSCRKKGQYGNYTTWRMLKAMALIGRSTIDMKSIYNARDISQQIGTSYYSTTQILKRARELGWLKKDKDVFGRKSWMMTEEGFTELVRRVRAKIRLDEGDDVRRRLPEIIDQAQNALSALRGLGMGDIMAREMLIRYPMTKILWAIDRTQAKMGSVGKPAAYVCALIKNGSPDERRIRAYIKKIAVMEDDVVDAIVMNAQRTVNPFMAAARAIRVIRQGYNGKRPIFVDKRDVSDIYCKLYDEKRLPKVKVK